MAFPEGDRVEDQDVSQVGDAVDGDDVEADEDGFVAPGVVGDLRVPIVEVVEGLVGAEARGSAEAQGEGGGEDEFLGHGELVVWGLSGRENAYAY